MTTYSYLSITEVSDLIRQQKVSSAKVVSECLDRIKQYNSKLNAFITVLGEQAMKDAVIADREIQNGHWKGPLHGIPVGIKDMYDTAGIKTTAAFVHFKDRVPEKDAVLVTKLKEAGAVLIGKMNMHELAMGTTSHLSYFGSVHNPWNVNYVAGGSSGGSAAAVAAGLCYATIDTDAIGSCRLPAACCGVTGFKGTYGLLSTEGILAGEKADENIIRLAHAAFMCRKVEDAATLLNTLANSEVNSITSDTAFSSTLDQIKNLRIGIVKNFKGTDEVQQAFLNVFNVVQSMGYTTIDMNAPLAPPADIKNIEEDRKKISQSLFGEVDAILLPTTADITPTIEEAKKIGPLAVIPDNTYFCNYYGLPAISLPCGFSKNGMPLGFQVVGPRWGESKVLNVAYALQQATPWHLEHPFDL